MKKKRARKSPKRNGPNGEAIPNLWDVSHYFEERACEFRAGSDAVFSDAMKDISRIFHAIALAVATDDWKALRRLRKAALAYTDDVVARRIKRGESLWLGGEPIYDTWADKGRPLGRAMQARIMANTLERAARTGASAEELATMLLAWVTQPVSRSIIEGLDVDAGRDVAKVAVVIRKRLGWRSAGVKIDGERLVSAGLCALGMTQQRADSLFDRHRHVPRRFRNVVFALVERTATGARPDGGSKNVRRSRSSQKFDAARRVRSAPRHGRSSKPPTRT